MAKQSFMSKVTTRISREAKTAFPPIQFLYMSAFSSGFRREQSAVAAGIARHTRSKDKNALVFGLRKTVHTLEKGLTMRPRRSEFGLTLVGPAVSGIATLAESWKPYFDSPEGRWVLSVMDGYFEATSESTSQVIARARLSYNTVTQELTSPRDLGPVHPERNAESAGYEALYALSRQRGSVRWYDGRLVDRDAVDRAVLAAAESPTACNRQPYRYYFFDDPEVIRKVASIPMGTKGWGDQIPGLAVLVGDLSAYFDERDRHLIYIDASLSAQAFLFGLEAQGISSCVINWPDIAFREKLLQDILGLEKYERPVMFISYGYADESGLVPCSEKRQIDQIREYRSI